MDGSGRMCRRGKVEVVRLKSMVPAHAENLSQKFINIRTKLSNGYAQ